jgi:hypothetical protein
MRWRWPPWRREEPDVHEIERSGATVARAREQTEVMTEQILRRSGEVEKAGNDLAEIVLRSMRPTGKAG